VDLGSVPPFLLQEHRLHGVIAKCKTCFAKPPFPVVKDVTEVGMDNIEPCPPYGYNGVQKNLLFSKILKKNSCGLGGRVNNVLFHGCAIGELAVSELERITSLFLNFCMS